MAEDGEFLAVSVAETLTKLQFLSVAEVASVAEAGHDVAVAVDDRVAGGGPYFAVVAKIFLYGLHALTAADDGRKKDFVWLAVAEQAVDGGNDACACCEHRVHEQESLAIDVGARHVFGFYLKTAVVLVTAIGGEEGVFGIVKNIQKSLVHWQGGAQDACNYYRVRYYVAFGCAERGSNVDIFVIQRLANLVCKRVGDAADVVAESLRILLDIDVAELHYPVAHGRRGVCKAM